MAGTKQASTHTQVRNAVTLVWGSLRLTPIRPHKVNFLFLVSVWGSIFSELCNQYSTCNHSVYTTCTQWLHHPSLYILAPGCLHFVVLSPDLTHPPRCILLFVHPFLSTLVSGKKNKKTKTNKQKNKQKKKPGALVIFKWLVGPETGKQLAWPNTRE